MSKRKRPRRRAPPHKRKDRKRREATAEVLERADALLEQGKAEEVVALLEPAVEKHPRSPDAHYLLGCAYVDTGDLWGGIRAIERALSLGGDRSDAVTLVMPYAQVGLRVHFLRTFRRARLWLRDLPSFDAIQEAVSLAEEEMAELAEQLGLSTRQMEEGLYHMEEGELALQQNDWATSMAASRRAIRYLGDWPPPHNNLSLALFYGGQPEEAIAEVRHVISVMPDNIHALSNGIRFLAWTGRESEARDLWARLRTIEPRHVDLQIKIAEAAAALGQDADVYRLLSPLDQDDLSEVRRGLSDRAKLHLAIAEANLGRRGARRKLEALKGTHSLADEVLAAFKAGKPGPGWADRYPYFHSSALLSREQLDELLGLVKQQETMDEERFRREIARFVRRYPQAVLAAEKLIWEENLVDSGVTMLHLLDTPEAHAALRRFGLSQAGEDAQRMNALQTLSEAGKIGPDEPLRVWLEGEWKDVLMRQLLISDEPMRTYDPAVIDLVVEATEASLEGDDQRADELYQRVLELEPRNREAHLNLGTIYVQRGEVERGKEMLRTALEIDPLYVHARCNLALLTLEEGNVEAAGAMIVPLGQVTRFYPEEMALYSYVQARILVAREEYDAARNLLQLSLEMEPDFGPSQELLLRIRLSHGLQEMIDGFSENMRKMTEASRKRSRTKRLKIQRELTTSSPGLPEALPLYLKNALTAMARIVMPWGGWSTLNKAALAERIAETLIDADELARVVADLDEEARAALREVVEAGATMPWGDFDARYDNDLEEVPEWDYHLPQTVMGQLRLHGLLVEATVDGELLVTIPAELRAGLGEILR
jgi:tetratricopeptide (TPR) repeat protein